jgi:tetratricopeptide (TPR) repeat protein
MLKKLKRFLSPSATAAADADACKNQGNEHLAKGELDAAAECYRQAIAVAPGYAEAYNNLGFVHLQRGNFDEASKCLDEALRLKPDLANAHYNLGMVRQIRGDTDGAIASYRQALSLRPDLTEPAFNLGCLLLLQGRNDEALACFQQVVAIDPDASSAHYNIGAIFNQRSEPDKALASFRRAVAITPNSAVAHNDSGAILMMQEKFGEAAACFRIATELDPDCAPFWSNLGAALQKQGLTDEALSAFQSALSRDEGIAECHANISVLFQELGRLEEALANARRAVSLNPALAGSHTNLGLVLQDMSRPDEAEACYRRALSIDPDGAQNARFNLAALLLSQGQLSEGWELYESRFFRVGGTFKRGLPQPEWQGESLAGRSIVIWGEQGIGDQILFAGLFRDVIAVAERCVIECAPKLLPLFARSFPEAQVVPFSDPPNAAILQRFDYQSSAGGLARWLRPTVASFPEHRGFLRPDGDRLAYWRNRLAGIGPGLKVGFCWRSGLRTGSRDLHYTKLDQWGPVFAVPGVDFVNLQYDRCEDELAEARKRFGVPLHSFDDVDLFNDIDEAAALTGALDLVISAPTAAGVLAAALDIPTWVMSYGRPWVTLGAEHIPWLPAQRLYARRWDQPWEEIIARLAEQLRRQAPRGGT